MMPIHPLPLPPAIAIASPAEISSYAVWLYFRFPLGPCMRCDAARITFSFSRREARVAAPPARTALRIS
jgi:hypothetical protein